MNETELHEGLLVANRYQLQHYIGCGSFGEVWLADDTELDIRVAIKLYISLDKSGQEEFKNEYRVVHGLKEEHLLTADYYGVWEHRPFFTMKYCSNGSAAKMVGKLDEAGVWKFIHDVAAGLKYLHSLEPPILHQDIKPENILADERGQFLITDFGISRKMRSTMRKQSKRSVGSGALAYMGPERFLNDPMAVKASDIWSLGVSAYELSTGDLPFMGQGGGMLLGGAQLPQLNPMQWSANLNDCITACMAKDTWERPTADQLVEFSQLMLDGAKVSWRKWFKDVSTSVQRPAKAKKVKAKAGDSEGKSGKGLLITLSVIAVVALAAGLYWFFGQGFKLPVSTGDDSLDRSEITTRYNTMIDVCRTDVRNADHNSYLLLVEARALLDSIDGMRDSYTYLDDKDNSVLEKIRTELTDKATSLHDRYIYLANGLLANDQTITAIEYLQIAGLMDNDATVEEKLLQLSRQYKAPSVFIAVTSARTDGGVLRVDYHGLVPKPINSLPIDYEISDGSNTVKGTVSVMVERGAHSFDIPLDEGAMAAGGDYRLKLSTNGVVTSRINID